MFTRILLAIGLCSAISLAQPGHRPPRKNPPPHPRPVVHHIPRPPAENVFSFKYSLKAHGIQCEVVNRVDVVKNADGTLTFTVKCAF